MSDDQTTPLNLTRDELTVLQVAWAKISANLGETTLPANLIDSIAQKIDQRVLSVEREDQAREFNVEALASWQDPLATTYGVRDDQVERRDRAPQVSHSQDQANDRSETPSLLDRTRAYLEQWIPTTWTATATPSRQPDRQPTRER
jgi:hypothetical protein